jgi:hypothetical protein
MRKLFLVSGVVGVGLLLLAFSGCSSGEPDIAVAATRHDFGTVKQGDVVTTEIAVRNRGDGNVKIESVSTSCGCTTARVRPEVIPPGSEGKLLIRYDSGSHPDKGRIRRHIYVATNDPNQEELEVVITANVQAPSKS